VLDGVHHIKLKKPSDIWKHKRLSEFIECNTTEGKRIKYQKRLDELKIKNEKEYFKRKELETDTQLNEQSFIESEYRIDTAMTANAQNRKTIAFD
jgi:hypothetical protein